ncbi:MAG: hypothetical protein ACK40L_19820, partial [Hydrogenophaga sp.]
MLRRCGAESHRDAHAPANGARTANHRVAHSHVLAQPGAGTHHAVAVQAAGARQAHILLLVHAVPLEAV